MTLNTNANATASELILVIFRAQQLKSINQYAIVNKKILKIARYSILYTI